jgi:hypothetical protein
MKAKPSRMLLSVLLIFKSLFLCAFYVAAGYDRRLYTSSKKPAGFVPNDENRRS